MTMLADAAAVFSRPKLLGPVGPRYLFSTAIRFCIGLDAFA